MSRTVTGNQGEGKARRPIQRAVTTKQQFAEALEAAIADLRRDDDAIVDFVWDLLARKVPIPEDAGEPQGRDRRMLEFAAAQLIGSGGDWACAECRPASHMLVAGFRCVVHEARHALADSELVARRGSDAP